jgi:tetratricopeptide (TPR) repeat protein
MALVISWLFLFMILPSSISEPLSISGSVVSANSIGGILGLKPAWNNSPPTNRLTVAILGFENKTGNPAESYWRVAASGLIDKALFEVKTIRCLPGIRYALKRLNKKEGDPIDKTEARKIGELIEARRVVWGDYQHKGTNWLVKVRVLNVATGTVKELSAISADWSEIAEKLSDQILQQFGIKPTLEEQQKMLRRLTSSPVTLEWLSKAMFLEEERKSYAEIEECGRKAVEADPKCAEAYNCLGAVLGSQGKTEEAEKMARESLKLKPDYPPAHITLAHIYAFQKKYGDAEDELSEAARLDPDNPEIFLLLSWVYADRDKEVLATASLKTAVRLSPFDAVNHAHLGYFFTEQGEREEAMAELRLAEQLALEDDVDTEQSLCQAYDNLHEVPSAIEHYETFVKLGKKLGLNPEMIQSFEKTLDKLKSSLAPVYVTAAMPKSYTGIEFTNALREKLTKVEYILVRNPLASTPEMDRWANELTAGTTNDLQKARILFDELARHVNGDSNRNSRTAREMFDDWNKPGQWFLCREYANFYVALARAVGLKAFFVLVFEEIDGKKCLHACAGVFISGKLLLVDPSYCWFGVPHKQFIALNDLQTTAVYLSQNHPDPKVARVACKITPDIPVVQFNLFFTLATADEWKEASETLTNALKLESVGSMADAANGIWALHEGKPEVAIELLQKSVNQDSSQPDFYTMLAQIFVGQGQLSQARDNFRKALSYGLSEEDAEQVRQAIAQINEKIGSD